ncbi:ATP-binding protein [Pseudonocardia sp.]|uniref:ATP-binding protein n=1 Tax=Pseudonocardia sp. TaxID=60912 RepID=UPI003D107C91
MAPRYVGRATELGGLARRLDAALAGDPSVVLVAGEPGIGKTRLVTELARLAGARGVPVLWGRCSDDAGAPAYWPWRGVLRALHATAPDALAAVDPTDLAEPALLAAGSAAGAGERFVLFDVVTRTLTAASATTGLLIALDDLQWADPDSLALLAHLARDAAGARLLVVATVRPGELGADPERAGHVARIEALPTAERLDLDGLADDEIADALADVLGGAPTREVVADVAARSGGNPFFVAELGRVLAAGALRDDAVPAAVRDVVRLRLARLPAGCRAVLDVAAVAGAEIDESLLRTVLGAPVADALRPALDDGVLVRPPGRTALRFAHDIVREALSDVLGAQERARLHGRLAVALAPRADDPDVLPELARHALAALAGGDPAQDPEQALDLARGAARLAGTRLAFAESARRHAHVLEAGRGIVAPARRARDLVELARAQLRAHAVSDAVATCASAVELARHIGDATVLAEAALVVQGISDAELLIAQRGWCDDALAAVGPDDGPLRAQLLAQLAHTLLFLGRPDEVEGRSREALAMAERIGDPASLVAALRARQLARSGPEGHAERYALGTRLLDLAADGAPDPVDAALWGRLWRFDALCQQGRFDDAEQELDRLAPVAAATRQPLARLHQLRSRIVFAFGRGRFDEVRRLNQEAAQLAEHGRHAGATMTALAVEWQVAKMVGDDGLDETRLDPGMVEAGRQSPVFAVLGTTMASWHLALYRRDEALRWYRDLPPPGSPRIPRFMCLVVEALRVQIAADLGDSAPMQEAYRFLTPFADLFVVGGAGATATHGSVQQYLGIAAGELGRTDVAIRHLRAGIDADDARGLAPFAASGRYRLAVVLSRRGRPGDSDEARALARRAAATAATLGMQPLRRMAAELVDNPRDGGVLSPREAEIAELVARGMTNRAIAETAHISERTVETHVAHILAKLGFSGRSQIAAWAVTRES